jgi:hypothetical protein
MPIPKPKSGEKQSDFMLRCVPQLMKYHPKDEAIAICYQTFKEKFKIDFKTLIIVGGLIVSLTMTYGKLSQEIDVLTTKIEYLVKDLEQSNQKIDDLEKKVYKK